MSQEKLFYEDGKNQKNLIFRPPVGAVVWGNTDGHDCCSRWCLGHGRRQRCLILFSFFCISLALASLLVLMWVLPRRTTTGSFERTYRVHLSHPRMEAEEKINFAPRAVSIRRSNLGSHPPVDIFFLLDKLLTIIRTQSVCYTHPLDPVVASLIPEDEAKLEQIREVDETNFPIKARLQPQVWMRSPNSDMEPFSFPSAASSCSGLPVFRLIKIEFSKSPRKEFVSCPELSCPYGCHALEDSNCTACVCPREDHQVDGVSDFFPLSESEEETLDEMPNSTDDFASLDMLPSNNPFDDVVYKSGFSALKRPRRSLPQTGPVQRGSCRKMDEVVEAVLVPAMKVLQNLNTALIFDCPQVALH